QAFDKIVVYARGNRLSCAHFKGPAQQGRLGYIRQTNAGHKCTFLRLDQDQTLGGKAPQRLGKRLARHAELFTGRRPFEARSRLKRETDDGRAQVFVDERSLRNTAMNRSRLDASNGVGHASK